MSKIFGLGLGRTGTTSLAKAMRILGYNAKHGPRTVDYIHDYDFSNDLIIAARYKFLDFCFPNSKFILTVREIESWINSCRMWSKGRKGRVKKSGGLNVPLRRGEHRFLLYKTTYFEEDKFRAAHERYYREVYEYFAGREILTMNICAGDGWEKLCPFLGKEIPDTPFPHRHDSRKFKKRVVGDEKAVW